MSYFHKFINALTKTIYPQTSPKIIKAKNFATRKEDMWDELRDF